MAWVYSQALRVGDEVTVTLREPTSGRSKTLPPLLRGGSEPEPAFVARGQAMIASHLRVLNGMFAIEQDVTNLFRPPPGGPTGGTQAALGE